MALWLGSCYRYSRKVLVLRRFRIKFALFSTSLYRKIIQRERIDREKLSWKESEIIIKKKESLRIKEKTPLIKVEKRAGIRREEEVNSTKGWGSLEEVYEVTGRYET